MNGMSGASPLALIEELQNGAELVNYYDKSSVNDMLSLKANSADVADVANNVSNKLQWSGGAVWTAWKLGGTSSADISKAVVEAIRAIPANSVVIDCQWSVSGSWYQARCLYRVVV